MRILRWTAVIGTGLGLAGLPAVAAVAVLLTARPALTALGHGAGDAADGVVAACAVAGAAALLWLGTTVLLATADELRARRAGAANARRRQLRATPGVPTVVRRLVALVVGVLLGSAALSATAAERGAAVTLTQVGWAAEAPVAPGALADPGWSAAPALDETSSRPEAPPPAAAADRATAAEVVVLRGDTLWSVAQSRCGPQATSGEVLAEQRRLYAMNADVIGDDPDLLLPGQILRLT